MARIAKITDDFAVAWQLEAEDFGTVAQQGFRSVINNRPDGEAGVYISEGEAAETAARNGLAYAFLPIDHVNLIDPAVADAFRALLDQLPKPILAYCRSGTRCSLIWALAAVRGSSVDRVIDLAAEAGYDISVLRLELEERAAGAKAPAVPAWPQAGRPEASTIV